MHESGSRRFGATTAGPLQLDGASLLCLTQLEHRSTQRELEEEMEEGGLKKSHSSPSLELEIAPPTVIKVKRNISERRTYRRTIVPRQNKEV